MIKGIVEIVPRLLNKGLIVKNVLREVQLRGNVDFILCMGDDIQDEKMFTVRFLNICGDDISLIFFFFSNRVFYSFFIISRYSLS